MKRIYTAILIVMAMVVLLPQKSFAHHSTGMFDFTKATIYKGTITKVDWANPHIYIYMDGKKADAPAADAAENWAMEGPTPNVLVVSGRLTKDEVKVGDTITVTGAPRKDGLPAMRIISMTLRSGKTVNISG